MSQLILPGRDPDQVAITNALVACLLPASVHLDNGEADPPCATVELAPSSPLIYTWRSPLYIAVHGLWRIEFSDLDLLSVRPELAAWLHADPGNSYAQLPGDLVRAVLERLLAPVSGHLSAFLGLPLQYAEPPDNQDGLFRNSITLVLAVQDSSLRTLVRCSWQDRSTILPLLPRLGCLTMRPVPPPPGARVAVHICLGCMHLSRQELISLVPGDVLLPDGLSLTTPTLLLGRQTWTTTLDTTQVTIRDCAGPERRTDMPDSQDIALEIRFELPPVQLPAGDCACLTPGYTFTLGACVEDLPVRVLVGETPVARGRLVDVGGVVGVQLTEKT